MRLILSDSSFDPFSFLRSKRETTIYYDCLTIDMPRRGGRQEDHHLSEIFWSSWSLATHNCGIGSREQARHSRRVDKTRKNRVEGDSRPVELRRQQTNEANSR